MTNCGLCGQPSPGNSLCEMCREDLTALQAENIPGPEATPEEVRAWAIREKITYFACNPSETP
jgi:hypothetical protein